MAYLLKEALKSICAVDHWSYAVFWKTGFQNPKLLIWEDCYYKDLPSSDLHNSNNGNKQLTLDELEMCWVSPRTYGSQLGPQMGDKVQLLVNKMMVANQVHVVGEGLVGRTMFSGNHQWIVLANYNGNGHPPEVINEVHVQFSAGMQTIAVIPVIPLGVIQLGSSLTITENIGFVHNVRNLVLQLDQVPNALLPDNFVGEETSKHIETSITEMPSVSTITFDSIKKPDSIAVLAGGVGSFQDPRLVNLSSEYLFSGVGDILHTTAPTIGPYNGKISNSHGSGSWHSLDYAAGNSNLSLKRPPGNKYVGADVSPVRSDAVLNQQPYLNMPVGSSYSHDHMKTPAVVNVCQGVGSNETSLSSTSMLTSQLTTNKSQYSDPSATWKAGGIVLQNGKSSNKVIGDGSSSVINQTFATVHSGRSPSEGKRRKADYTSVKKEEKHAHEVINQASSLISGQLVPYFKKIHGGNQFTSCENDVVEDFLAQSSGEDDLFAIVGMEFKNKNLKGVGHNFNGNAEAYIIDQLKGKSLDPTSSLNTRDNKISESGIFSSSCSDHLLEAVVSGIHHASSQNSDDSMSCATTLTKASTSSTPNNFTKFGPVKLSKVMGELSGHSKPSTRTFGVGPTSTMSGFGKNKPGDCPQSRSFYESQMRSWVEQGPAKCETSIGTENSKNADFAGKPNRKRLKPGENPRPRPKDRQMIQDRVKELREIIPNGAKCSIDALLERTIKHMLFLESVSKHADKLKKTEDSKMFNKDGGVVLKDNFEGGATWAFEVGSQSMVCPIVVEDLNPPRQLLVEMLCEEKGFFMEIVDVIRGMGLTILKGVMEARGDKIWGRFAVEANRDVSRMEIFVSLVHLVERSARSNNAPVEDGASGQHVFNQGASHKQQLISS